MAEERLQKFLAAGGVASRRKAEALITAGRVKVNQKVVTELGTKVDPARDLVTVDGKLVSQPDVRSYYLLYKPPGLRHHRLRSGGAADRDPVPGRRPGPGLPGRAARLRRRGGAALHRRRRAGQPAGPPALRPPAGLPGQGAGRARSPGAGADGGRGAAGGRAGPRPRGGDPRAGRAERLDPGGGGGGAVPPGEAALRGGGALRPAPLPAGVRRHHRRRAPLRRVPPAHPDRGEDAAAAGGAGAGRAEAARPQARPKRLPRAARRHGHGPPPAPGAEPEAPPPEAEADGSRRAERPKPLTATGSRWPKDRSPARSGRDQGGPARTRTQPERRASKKGSSRRS